MMKNKNYLKSLILYGIITIIFVITIILSSNITIKKYEQSNNIVIASIIENIKKYYPNVDEEKILDILNSSKASDFYLNKYGIYVDNEAIALINKNAKSHLLIKTTILITIYITLIILIFFKYNHNETKKIKKITKYLKEINNRNYKLDIESNSEDELSLLKNEIYKTAITLNEQTKLLSEEKTALKNSLSDISHQLKTPLTSITLMIDTLLDSKNMDETKKKELLINIHRKINNTSFLIANLLKLSKFDANTIEFKDTNNNINNILNDVVDNLSILCDLKNVTINISGNSNELLYCDYKWQVEAITNIVKNCIEHSKEQSEIDISYLTNDLFTKITITDYGTGMDKQDTNHIFDRFYKGKISSPDSVGIGLSLSKSIIEKDNGTISVKSTINEGSTFTIKYFK